MGFEYMGFKKEYMLENPDCTEEDITKGFLLSIKEKVNYNRYRATCPMQSNRCQNIECEDCELFIPPEELGIETKLPDPPGLVSKAEFDKLTGEIAEFNKQINLAFATLGEDLTRGNIKLALLHQFIVEIGAGVGCEVPKDLNALVEQELQHIKTQQQEMLAQMQANPVIPGKL